MPRSVIHWTTALPAALLALAVGAGTRGACDTQTWSFDVRTEGEDVFWTSPSSVDVAAPRYDLAYEITLLEVDVTWLIFQFTIDVTKEIPPEFRAGSAIIDGPPPIVLFDGHIAFPPPPDPPGLEADVLIGIDADGFGQLSMTDVTLGEITVVIPDIGEQTVQLDAVRARGTIDVTPLSFAADVNADGVVSFEDLLAVLGAWGPCPVGPAPCPEDADGDGLVGFSDLLEVLSAWGATYECG